MLEKVLEFKNRNPGEDVNKFVLSLFPDEMILTHKNGITARLLDEKIDIQSTVISKDSLYFKTAVGCYKIKFFTVKNNDSPFDDIYQDYNTLEKISEEEYQTVYDLENALEVFISKGEFIAPPDREYVSDPLYYLWNDPKQVDDIVNKILSGQLPYYIYTLINDDTECYIVPYYHFVNRVGHFISKNKIDIGEKLKIW